MSARLANIKRGSADVVVDGKVIGWVVRTEYDRIDENDKTTGTSYELWDAVEPDPCSGGVVNGMPYRTRREAVAALVARAEVTA